MDVSFSNEMSVWENGENVIIEDKTNEEQENLDSTEDDLISWSPLHSEKFDSLLESQLDRLRLPEVFSFVKKIESGVQTPNELCLCGCGKSDSELMLTLFQLKVLSFHLLKTMDDIYTNNDAENSLQKLCFIKEDIEKYLASHESNLFYTQTDLDEMSKSLLESSKFPKATGIASLLDKAKELGILRRQSLFISDLQKIQRALENFVKGCPQDFIEKHTNKEEPEEFNQCSVPIKEEPQDPEEENVPLSKKENIQKTPCSSGIASSFKNLSLLSSASDSEIKSSSSAQSKHSEKQESTCSIDGTDSTAGYDDDIEKMSSSCDTPMTSPNLREGVSSCTTSKPNLRSLPSDENCKRQPLVAGEEHHAKTRDLQGQDGNYEDENSSECKKENVSNKNDLSYSDSSDSSDISNKDEQCYGSNYASALSMQWENPSNSNHTENGFDTEKVRKSIPGTDQIKVEKANSPFGRKQNNKLGGENKDHLTQESFGEYCLRKNENGTKEKYKNKENNEDNPQKPFLQEDGNEDFIPLGKKNGGENDTNGTQVHMEPHVPDKNEEGDQRTRRLLRPLKADNNNKKRNNNDEKQNNPKTQQSSGENGPILGSRTLAKPKQDQDDANCQSSDSEMVSRPFEGKTPVPAAFVDTLRKLNDRPYQDIGEEFSECFKSEEDKSVVGPFRSRSDVSLERNSIHRFRELFQCEKCKNKKCPQKITGNSKETPNKNSLTKSLLSSGIFATIAGVIGSYAQGPSGTPLFRALYEDLPKMADLTHPSSPTF